MLSLKISLICPSNEGGDMGLYGLMSLGTYLKSHGNDVSIIEGTLGEIDKQIAAFCPDIIGITSMTGNFHMAKTIAGRLKEKFGLPLILGGTHISCLPESLSEEFDIGVVGEGEHTMLELVELFKRGKNYHIEDLSSVQGICYHHNGEVKITEPRSLALDLNDFPIPDRSLVNSDFFTEKKINRRSVRQAGLMTSRGCPFKCSFCASSVFWEKTRAFSPERVVEEIEYLHREFKINDFAVWDDLFTLNKNRIKTIGKLLEKKGLLGKITFGGHARANRFDDETAGLLGWIGFKTVGFGFESGSERMLRMIKPGVSQKDNINAVKVAKKHEFDVYAYIIIGNPGEKLDDIKQTLEFMDFMLDKKVDCCMVFTALPFPGTKYWEIARQRGLLNDKILSNMNQNDPLNPIMLDKDIDIMKYQKLAREAIAKSKLFGMQKRNSNFQLLVKSMRNPKLAYDYCYAVNYEAV